VQVRADQIRADAGWWAQSLTSTLIVGPGSLRLLETWSVVAEMPLDEVLVPLNLDVGPDAVVPAESVIYGGELSADPWPHRSPRPEIAVRLPKLLDVLDRHDFGLRVEVPVTAPPTEHLCRPMVGCRSLEVRVRFLGSGAPSAVRVVGADGGAELIETRPAAEWTVDAVGEVVVRFHDLLPGAVRGVRWSGGTGRR
jgi:hypothetical protein